MTKEKVDLYKLHKAEYVAPKQPVVVDTRKAQYLAISGRGAPGGEAFQAKIGALYGVAFTIKMTRKFEGKGDYVISKLEGQYWTDPEDLDFKKARPEELNWRLLIRTPDFVSKQDLTGAAKKLTEKNKGGQFNEIERVSLAEGKCVQMLYVGPYDKESETVEKMMAFAELEGWEANGRHHEIYLSDPRRVAPEKLKTILRMPVQKKVQKKGTSPKRVPKKAAVAGYPHYNVCDSPGPPV